MCAFEQFVRARLLGESFSRETEHNDRHVFRQRASDQNIQAQRFSARKMASPQPRRSARVADQEERRLSVLGPLSLDACLLVLGLLKEDLKQLARCMLVSKAWRQAVSQPALWARLDLRAVPRRLPDELLLGTTRLAAGRLLELRLHDVRTQALRTVLGRNPQLVVLKLDRVDGERLTALSLLGLLADAAAVEVVESTIRGTPTEVLHVLHSGGPSLRLTGVWLVAGPGCLQALGRALRGHLSLRVLDIAADFGLWRDMDAAAAFLRSLVGHPSLLALDLLGNWPPEEARRAAGAALGALVAANGPLTELYCQGCMLGDMGLLELVAALPGNTRLQLLRISLNRMTPEFAHERLLPAVRANASLRELRAEEMEGDMPEAMALVAARDLASRAAAA